MAQLTPRERFQQDAARLRTHQELVDSSGVQHSIDMAMLGLNEDYSRDISQTASLNYYRLQGAQDFLRHWRQLAELTRRAVPRRTDELLDPDEPKPKKP